jgi:hypothetical protein
VLSKVIENVRAKKKRTKIPKIFLDWEWKVSILYYSTDTGVRERVKRNNEVGEKHKLLG